MKDNADDHSWFSAKPIIVGSLSNILAGTELNLRQDVHFYNKISLNEACYKNTFLFVYIGGSWRFYRWVCGLEMAKMDLKLSDIEW